MEVGDRDAAIAVLRRINYYRLSGYWYPFRQLKDGDRGDDFYPATRLADVVALYDFDATLRAATFSVLTPIELAFRALLGHELGRIDPCVHLDPGKLGPRAQHGDSYRRWLAGYKAKLDSSREDFVVHRHRNYGGTLPVWAAVEVLDWGGLTYLFEFAPRKVQDVIAAACGLRAPQLASWPKAPRTTGKTQVHSGRSERDTYAQMGRSCIG
ncbi:Abi family protein [Jiangella rhizosphaerae]|uniref:Abi family protein n=2 Tax=Jiangella rhizosphaerae TaxID=2293569 RepID=A0A418KU35_9ACTN|nr:Abi family protein [Jiangella rhizosphaerae]